MIPANVALKTTLCLLGAAWPATALPAQWTATVLEPPGATLTECSRVEGSRQVGYAYFGSVPHAGSWTGSAGSWVDLHPGNGSRSSAFDLAGNAAVGEARIGTLTQASVWNLSTGASAALHPAGATSSFELDVHQGQQVGRAVSGSIYHAALWTGSAGSWFDVQPFLPPSFRSSQGFGVWRDANGTLYVVGVAQDDTQRSATPWWARFRSGVEDCDLRSSAQRLHRTAGHPMLLDSGLRRAVRAT